MQIKNAPESTGKRQPVNSWSGWFKWLAFAVPFLTAELVYFLTSAAGLTLRLGGDDGGDLATTVALDGVPHPTGYPIYLLTGKLLSFLATDPARALTLATAFWGALAAGVLSLAVFRLNHRLLAPTQHFYPFRDGWK